MSGETMEDLFGDDESSDDAQTQTQQTQEIALPIKQEAQETEEPEATMQDLFGDSGDDDNDNEEPEPTMEDLFGDDDDDNDDDGGVPEPVGVGAGTGGEDVTIKDLFGDSDSEEDAIVKPTAGQSLDQENEPDMRELFGDSDDGNDLTGIPQDSHFLDDNQQQQQEQGPWAEGAEPSERQPGQEPGLDREPTEEEEPQMRNQALGAPTHMPILEEIKMPADPQNTWLIKLPNILAIDPKPFEVENFEPPDDTVDVFSESNVMRWRWELDENGVKYKHSNSQMVQWEDGSWNLFVGGEAFVCEKKAITDLELGLTVTLNSKQIGRRQRGEDVYMDAEDEENEELVMPNDRGIRLRKFLAPMKVAASFRPMGMETITHQRLKNRLGAKYIKQPRLKRTVLAGRNPEAELEEVIATYEHRAKQEELRRTRELLKRKMMQRAMPREERRRSRGVTPGFLTQGNPDLDDDGEASFGGTMAAIRNLDEDSDQERKLLASKNVEDLERVERKREEHVDVDGEEEFFPEQEETIPIDDDPVPEEPTQQTSQAFLDDDESEEEDMMASRRVKKKRKTMDSDEDEDDDD